MIISFGDFELDDEHLTLSRSNTVVLTRRVINRLLAVLVQHAGEIVTREQLMREVWGGRAVQPRNVVLAIARLRRILSTGDGEQGRVETVYGRGYRFVGRPTVRTHACQVALADTSFDPERAAEGPFVGRTRVMARLQAAANDAYRGRGRLCVLMGEPGIGKTRTVTTLAHRLISSEAEVRRARCIGPDAPPMSLWSRLLCEPAASVAPEGPEPARPSGHPHAPYEHLASRLAGDAHRVPCVLIAEDLHLADPASLDLLAYVIDELAHSRVLVLATLRLGAGRHPPRPETRLPYVLGHRNCDRIFLERLGEQEVDSYVDALVERASAEAKRALFAESQGNPRLMVELTRQLVATQSSGREHAFSDEALDPIRARLSPLDAETRAVLTAAAVLGRAFQLAQLQSATGRSASSLMTCLDRAVTAELLLPSTEGKTQFQFSQELVRWALLRAHDRERSPSDGARATPEPERSPRGSA